MKTIHILCLVLSAVSIQSCRRSADGTGQSPAATQSGDDAEVRRKQAEEALRHIQERDERTERMTEKMKNSPPGKGGGNGGAKATDD